jgi:ADP-ribose pyrophosphatase YjhB (NUDIX family)
MAARAYPDWPVVGVGAVVIIEESVVLVRRRYEPLAGQWSIPGGRVELGEELREAVRREAWEEIGLEVEVGPLVAGVDRISRDPEGRVEYHYVLLDYLCHRRSGTVRAGSDAAEAALVPQADLDAYALAAITRDVINRAFAVSASDHPEDAGAISSSWR